MYSARKNVLAIFCWPDSVFDRNLWILQPQVCITSSVSMKIALPLFPAPFRLYNFSILDRKLTSHYRDPCSPSAASLWLVAFALHAIPTSSSKYLRSWMTAAQSLAPTPTTNWYKRNCSTDDRRRRPSTQWNSSWSIWTYSPKHSKRTEQYGSV